MVIDKFVSFQEHTQKDIIHVVKCRTWIWARVSFFVSRRCECMCLCMWVWALWVCSKNMYFAFPCVWNGSWWCNETVVLSVLVIYVSMSTCDIIRLLINYLIFDVEACCALLFYPNKRCIHFMMKQKCNVLVWSSWNVKM